MFWLIAGDTILYCNDLSMFLGQNMSEKVYEVHQEISGNF